MTEMVYDGRQYNELSQEEKEILAKSLGFDSDQERRNMHEEKRQAIKKSVDQLNEVIYQIA